MMFCGTLYLRGIAFGSARGLAFAGERADPQRRGKQMATFSVAYPLSYGVGSMITGSAVAVAGYAGMFYMMAAVQAALALTERDHVAGLICSSKGSSVERCGEVGPDCICNEPMIVHARHQA